MGVKAGCIHNAAISVLNQPPKVKVKGKGKGRDTCYSASYNEYVTRSALQSRKRLAADWHELMIPQRTMRPSIARVSEQLDPRFAASRHTTAPISNTRHSPPSP